MEVTSIEKTRRETVSIAMEMNRRKKKGRSSLSELSKREINKPPVVHHFSRRNRNFESKSPAPEFEEGEDEDEDERKQKKVKLVVSLPHQSNQNQHLENHSSSAADSETEVGENHEASIERTKINFVDRRSDDAVSDQVLYFEFRW